MGLEPRALLAEALKIKQGFDQSVRRRFLVEKACNRKGVFDRKDIERLIGEVIPLWDKLPDDADYFFVLYGITREELSEEFARHREEEDARLFPLH